MFVADGSGFFVDVDNSLFEFNRQSSDVVTTDDLYARRCVILLGEPGMGKTTTIENHVPLARADVVDQSIHINLAEYASEERPCKIPPSSRSAVRDST
jgi:hypothetical protein